MLVLILDELLNPTLACEWTNERANWEKKVNGRAKRTVGLNGSIFRRGISAVGSNRRPVRFSRQV